MEIESWAICRMKASHRADGRCSLLISILFRLPSDCRLHPKLHWPMYWEWPMPLYALWEMRDMMVPSSYLDVQFSRWHQKTKSKMNGTESRPGGQSKMSGWMPFFRGEIDKSRSQKVRTAKSVCCGLANWESSEERDKYPHFQFAHSTSISIFRIFPVNTGPTKSSWFNYCKFSISQRTHRIELMLIRGTFGLALSSTCGCREAPKSYPIRAFNRLIAVLVRVFMMHYRS